MGLRLFSFDGLANWSEATANLGLLESINYELPFF